MLMPSIFGNVEDLFDFDNFFHPAGNTVRYNMPSANMMRTDVKELQTGYELDIDLPGYKKDNIKIELKNGYLTIGVESGQNQEEKDQEGKYIRRERYYGTCSRSFYVGDDVTQQEIKARFEDGILKVFVPKKEAKPAVEESKYIQIEG